MNAPLAVRGLTIRAGGRLLCRDLDLDLGNGERWAVLGPNGAGKTSLLQTLAGLRPPAAGEVLLEGEPLRRLRRRRVALRLGMLLQEERDPFPVTVLEAVLAGRHPHLGPWQPEGEHDRALAREALGRMGLAGFERRALATLSGGERRRVGLATLFCQDPAIWLLDEPLDQLDLGHQARLLRELDGLARMGRTVISVLHDPTTAARHADRALLLFGDGESLAGPAAEVLTEARLTRLYGHPLFAVSHPSGPAFLPGA